MAALGLVSTNARVSEPHRMGLLSVEHVLGLDRGRVADLGVEPPVIEPVDVFERPVLDLVGSAPRRFRVDQFGLEQPDGRFGHGVVDRAADRTNGGAALISASRSVQRILVY